MSSLFSSSGFKDLLPGLGCVSRRNGGLTNSFWVVKEEAARTVVAVDAVPRSAEDGLVRLLERGPSE